ncbi:MAG: hypothetical protein QOK05_3081 [Chloroflexota bacterium]|jgi:predicted short-subunit dehydrogenase-like oxidoreductase (DUF2520 family)|nr:hypothetical protein [Chloroflexota bacterium]
MARLPEPQVLGTGTDAESQPQPLTIGFIGSGRAASTLGHSLRRAGHRLLVARRGASAEALAAQLGAGLVEAVDILARADVTLLAVPDGAVGPLASALAEVVPDGDGRVVAHLAGSAGRDALAALERRGYATAAVHPLQVLSGWRIAPGTAFAVEADGAARVVAGRLVEDMHGIEIPLPAEGRAAYHAAAVMAANLGMTMLAEAVDLMEKQGIPRAEALSGLGSLVRGGLEASMDRGLPAALTGPVTRGDVETVAGHLSALAGDPELRRAYAASSLLALRQARRDGRPADKSASTRLQELLEGAL